MSSTSLSPPTPPRLVVAAALVDNLGRPQVLLAARRSAPPRDAGKWELPGGKVEPGESPEQALHRELTEELGVSVVLGAEAPGPDDGMWPLGRGYVMRWWWGQITGGEPRPLEDHDRLQWVNRACLPTLGWLESNRAITEHLAARMQ